MSKTEKTLLLCWLLLNLILGLLIVRDFGLSYDEPDYYLYAQNSVDAYDSFFALAYMPAFGPHDLPHYGPAFIIFPELATRLLNLSFPGIQGVNVWHFSYFLLFQLGGLCLYSLARRWFNSWSAWGILLLYTSQPLLWGHAFINPKDIPFLAFFLFTVWSGFRLGDSLQAQDQEAAGQVSGKESFSLPALRVRDSLPYLRSPQLMVAGVLLGMTMSIRLLGPLPGLIVILFLAFTLRRNWLAVTIAYLMVAVVTMFLTWPALWANPINHWMDSLVLMVNFPWPGRVLFNGKFYDPESLPLSYVPVLLNIQLSESLLALIYLGFARFVFAVLRKRLSLDLLFFLMVGGLLPLVGLTLSRATLYDNFRQLLFLLPAWITMAGLALDWIFTWLPHAPFRFIVLLALVLPGILAIVQLHPYSYVYYNSLAGGTGGAFRKFELDYWCTSYREAALWLNLNAPANAKIGGSEATELLKLYLRDDLTVLPQAQPGEQLDYFVAASRYNQDLTLFPDGTVVHRIERDEAALTVIKKLSPAP